MAFLKKLFCVWCSLARERYELNLYRQHTLVCVTCTRRFKVSKADYIPLDKKEI